MAAAQMAVVEERSSLLLVAAAVGGIYDSRVREVVASGVRNLQVAAAADEEAINEGWRWPLVW